jgi:hypothetical protein
MEITEPGVYEIDADAYHADPVPGGSLSSTGARRLLPPSCPALFHYEREHGGGPRRPEFDIGTAAHRLVLGVGPALVRVDAKDWRTKKAREQRDEAHEQGAVPLLAADHAHVHGMAEALYADALARVLLNPDRGRSEQAIFWEDPETGVWRRALIDRLDTGGSPLTIVDYKTTVSADPDSIRKSVHRYGYHQQAVWYLDAATSIGYPDDTTFKFIFQEKTPPYVVTVVELASSALRVGAVRNRRAIEIYRDCEAAGVWPGHATDIEVISLPAWAERVEEYAW